MGESQGGLVASRLACLCHADVVVLLSSLPDTVDVPVLREREITVAIGWKVRSKYCIASRAASHLFVCQAGETLWDEREGAKAIVSRMGPRACLSEDFPGSHSSWKAEEASLFSEAHNNEHAHRVY